MIPNITIILFCQLIALFNIAGLSIVKTENSKKRSRMIAYTSTAAFLTMLPAGLATIDTLGGFSALTVYHTQESKPELPSHVRSNLSLP